MVRALVTMAQLDIPTAGTRVQVSATSTPVSTIIVQGAEGNAGKIFVGDLLVSSSRGISLDPGEFVSFAADFVGGSGHEFLLSDFYIDAATNGDDAKVSYVKVK